MKKKASWFGIKTLYRVGASGRPLGKDRLYSKNMTMVEERVVVVRADSWRSAIRIGEAEAREYARSRHRNPYGQQVRIRYMGFVDLFDINEPVRDRTEVYSSTEVIHRRVTDRAVIYRLIGRPESKRTYASRRNILDLVFSGLAPGVRPTRSERAFRNKINESLKRRDA